MTTQLTLIADTHGHCGEPTPAHHQLHHRGDPETSVAAAKAIRSELGRIQREVLAIIGYVGRPITAEEVHEIYCREVQPCGYSTARTRVGELHRLGLIREWGKVGHNGRAMMAYVVAEGGAE